MRRFKKNSGLPVRNGEKDVDNDKSDGQYVRKDHNEEFDYPVLPSVQGHVGDVENVVGELHETVEECGELFCVGPHDEVAHEGECYDEPEHDKNDIREL